MRISDWSSDVCSSDLHALPADRLAPVGADRREPVAAADAGVGCDHHGRWPDHGRQLAADPAQRPRSEEHTSELQSLMRISYAVFCLKKKKKIYTTKKQHIYHYTRTHVNINHLQSSLTCTKI